MAQMMDVRKVIAMVIPTREVHEGFPRLARGINTAASRPGLVFNRDGHAVPGDLALGVVAGFELSLSGLMGAAVADRGGVGLGKRIPGDVDG